ncbi:MAG: helix-turn-helix domain-containing protein [Sphingopyxis sp.]|nr:helix-turn-helix domain-containing protein [Sphingopyxis sp.]
MINSIRSVRRAKKMTLEDVAARCKPPTTAQTIGRLETGTRTLSLGWLNRIAAALNVEPRDLVAMPDEETLAVAAIVGGDGAHAPTRAEQDPPLRAEPGMVAVRFATSIGDYRTGDSLWCRRIARGAFATALNRDVLVPRPAGRFLFGRLLAIDDDKMQILPLVDGARQQVVAQGEWLAVAVRIIRTLGA